MVLNKLFGRRAQLTPAARREVLLRTGRVLYGSVLDWKTDETGAPTEIIFTYTVGGVDYESSHTLSEMQLTQGENYAPGSVIQIRYHHHNPTDATVV